MSKHDREVAALVNELVSVAESKRKEYDDYIKVQKGTISRQASRIEELVEVVVRLRSRGIEDMKYTIEQQAITIEELEQYNLDYAVREQELTTERDVLKVDVCKRCNGTGYEGGNVAGGYYCPACNGKGY